VDVLMTIPTGDTLGEGILWDDRAQALWWTDIQGKRLHRYDWASRALQTRELPQRLCSFALIEGDDRLLAAFDSGISLFDPASGEIRWLHRLPASKQGIRFNDGRVDRHGRFWVGTMVENGDERISASLYCLDHDGQLHERETGIRISNGLCSSPNGQHLYFADSPRGTVWRYALDGASGAIGARQTWVTSAAGASPDGATVDAEGHVWSAKWGAGRVVRYRPDGSVDTHVPVPASQPTCVAFGGPDLDLMFITSARDELEPGQLAEQPQAGHVFVVRPGVRGLPECRYRLASSAALLAQSG